MRSVDFAGLQSIESIQSAKTKKKKKATDVSKRRSFMKFKTSGGPQRKLSKSKSFVKKSTSKKLTANRLSKDRSRVLKVSVKKV
jgi:hypothetical protein